MQIYVVYMYLIKVHMYYAILCQLNQISETTLVQGLPKRNENEVRQAQRGVLTLQAATM